MEKESLQALVPNQIRESFRAEAWDLFFSTIKLHEMANLEATPVYNERRVKLIRTTAARRGTHLAIIDRLCPSASLQQNEAASC